MTLLGLHEYTCMLKYDLLKLTTNQFVGQLIENKVYQLFVGIYGSTSMSIGDNILNILALFKCFAIDIL